MLGIWSILNFHFRNSFKDIEALAARSLSKEGHLFDVSVLEFLLHRNCSIHEINLLRNFTSMEIINYKRHNFISKVLLMLNIIFEKTVEEC